MTGGNPATVAHPQTAARHTELGRVIRAARKRLGLSQEQLAEKAGCDRQSVNRVENARTSPSIHSLWMLADALDVPASELLATAERPAGAHRPGGQP